MSGPHKAQCAMRMSFVPHRAAPAARSGNAGAAQCREMPAGLAQFIIIAMQETGKLQTICGSDSRTKSASKIPKDQCAFCLPKLCK